MLSSSVQWASSHGHRDLKQTETTTKGVERHRRSRTPSRRQLGGLDRDHMCDSRDRGRETERDREISRETERDRERARERDRARERAREREREREREAERRGREVREGEGEREREVGAASGGLADSGCDPPRPRRPHPGSEHLALAQSILPPSGPNTASSTLSPELKTLMSPDVRVMSPFFFLGDGIGAGILPA